MSSNGSSPEERALAEAQHEFEIAMERMEAAWKRWTSAPASDARAARAAVDEAAQRALVARELVEFAERAVKGAPASSARA